MSESKDRRERAIYDVIRAIPRGRVATYGQVAELAGLHRGHRLVAAALRAPPDDVPWQRVVGKHGPRRGKVSILDAEGAARQRRLLNAEGVTFEDSGLISLSRHGWLPC